MSRKELTLPVAVAVLSVAFAVVCFMVWLGRGRPFLVRQKLKLGALLISLSHAGLTGCDSGEVTCYAPAPPPNQIELDAEWQGEAIVVAPGGALAGTISWRQAEAFAFRLVDAAGGEAQRGPLVPADGAFDESDEAFTLGVGADLTPGDYRLEFYRGLPGDIAPVRRLAVFPLRIEEARRVR
jgi:hypothetical protein